MQMQQRMQQRNAAKDADAAEVVATKDAEAAAAWTAVEEQERQVREKEQATDEKEQTTKL